MELTKQEIQNELWRRGNLSWKCHTVQREMYDLYYRSPKNTTLVWLLSRQMGKSYLLAILSLEFALKKENQIIKMVTDTKQHLKSIFEKIFVELLVDCPQDLQPTYKASEFTYYFPNGSQIQLAGTDNKHYEKLRGQKCSAVFVDEAGFCNDLEEVVKSVLLPTTTHTGGNIVLASTPPPSLDHEFIKFIEEAEMNNVLTKKTVYENPLLNKEQIDRIEIQMGGKNSPRFRREYLCELLKDDNLSVIPEFTDDLAKDIVKDWPLPPFFDCYEAMDLGGKDLTVVLFAYYDFRSGKVIVQDELVLDFSKPNVGIKELVDGIKSKEEFLWTTLSGEVKPLKLRVSDINYIVTSEISKASGGKINFTIAKKDDPDAAINNLRTMLSSKKIIIHPRCQTLIRHLKNVRWYSVNNKTKFARSPDDGHYDCVAALVYLVRHILYNQNPYPANYGLNMTDLYVQNKEKFQKNPQQIDALKKIFNLEKKPKTHSVNWEQIFNPKGKNGR